MERQRKSETTVLLIIVIFLYNVMFLTLVSNLGDIQQGIINKVYTDFEG